MAVWRTIFEDKFGRADTTAGGAGTTTGGGNSWTDLQGGVASISSNRLKMTGDGIDGGMWLRDNLWRPSTDGGGYTADQRVIAETTGTFSTNIVAAVLLRWTNSGGNKSYYMCWWNIGSNQIQIFKVINNTPAALGTGSTTGIYGSSSDRYQFDAIVTGSAPTATVSLRVTNLTTGATVNVTTTDTGSAGSGPPTTGCSVALSMTTVSAAADTMYWSTFRAFTPATAATTTIANSANVLLSLLNWQQDGANAWIKTTNAGAYLRTTIAGTTSAYLDIDNVTIAGQTIPQASWPQIAFAIDDKPVQIVSLSDYGAGQGSILLASGLTTGSHLLQVWVKSNSGREVRLLNLRMDGGATIAAPTARSKKLLGYGDSMSIAANVLRYPSDANDGSGADATKSWVVGVAGSLDAEYGLIGYGGWGYTQGGLGGIGPIFTPGNPSASYWDKYLDGTSRLSGGLYATMPDYIFIMSSFNDNGGSDATVRAAVAGCLAAIRGAAPGKPIFVIPSPGRQGLSKVQNGFNDYQASTPDALCFFVDMGTIVADGMGSALVTGGSIGTNDGVHPDHARQLLMAAIIAHYTGDKLATPAATSGGSFGSVCVF